MKTIGSFVEGKIRRSEAGDRLGFDPSARGSDPDLGVFEGRLVSEAGTADFFRDGMELSDGTRVRWASIAKVVISPNTGGERLIDVVLEDGTIRRIRCTAAGGVVIHATLRWIGNAVLRRPIAE